ncbi:MAG: creatininase family protein [Armatimonadetes bacterium]|nr:creatininase family protein [Armatimonadota bacterium]
MHLKAMLPYRLRLAVAAKWPVLVPAGCVECHGHHMGLGNDTLVAEALCEAIAARIPAAVAPTIDYGPTGYAVSGPEMGTMDMPGDAFAPYVKEVLRGLWRTGFAKIIVMIHHQGTEGPEGIAFRKAASELPFEMMLEERGTGWWGRSASGPEDISPWGRIRVAPTILPKAAPACPGDHAGEFETSVLMHLHPEMVELERLRDGSLWYCEQPGRESRNASPEAGRRYFEAMLAAWLEELS